MLSKIAYVTYTTSGLMDWTVFGFQLPAVIHLEPVWSIAQADVKNKMSTHNQPSLFLFFNLTTTV